MAFGDMNPEQQGRLAEFIGMAILRNGSGTFTATDFIAVSDMTTLTVDQFQVILDAHATLLAG